jgi:hypothetical protein
LYLKLSFETKPTLVILLAKNIDENVPAFDGKAFDVSGGEAEAEHHNCD